MELIVGKRYWFRSESKGYFNIYSGLYGGEQTKLGNPILHRRNGEECIVTMKNIFLSAKDACKGLRKCKIKD